MKIQYLPPTSLLPDQRVEIEVAGGDWPGVYASRVVSVTGKDLTLEAPIRDGVFVPLRSQTPLVVRTAAGEGMISFETEVIERRPGAFPVFVVARPARLMAVQRRDFFRVSTQLPVLFDLADPKNLTDAREQAGLILNLSAGGAALRAALAVGPDDDLRLRLPLDDREGEMRIAAQIVGVEIRRARHDIERIARLRFSGLSLHDENRLFRFIRALERTRLRQRRAFWDE